MRKKITHVVLAKTRLAPDAFNDAAVAKFVSQFSTLRCLRCGQHHWVVTPCSIPTFSRQCKAFESLHATCEEGHHVFMRKLAAPEPLEKGEA